MATEKVVLPIDHFQKRVNHQYNDVPMAICREILQNSQDAGAKEVEFVFADSEFSASDDGCGMDLESFREFYLTLGGTKKNSGSIGGFGAAKELLSYAWPTWIVKSKGFSVLGQGAGEIISREDNSQKKGFFVGATDESFNRIKFFAALIKLLGLSDLALNVNVEVTDTKPGELPKGRKLRSNQLVTEFEFGSLYVHKGNKNNSEETGLLYIRTKGLYTCQEHVGGDYVWYLDLQSASPEVLTENRDSLRWDIKSQIQQYVNVLIKNPTKIEKRSRSRITLYGSPNRIGGATRATDENISMSLSNGKEITWRKPFAIADDIDKNGKSSAKGVSRNGYLIGKYAKALEVWSTALNLISDTIGLDRFIPGLYFSSDANAVHAQTGAGEAILVLPERALGDNPFELMELAIHEIAHHWRDNHSQEYESARMNEIVRKVGKQAIGIMLAIQQAQGMKAPKGAYWEV